MKKKIIILLSSIAMITLVSLSLKADDPCKDLRDDMCIESTLWCAFEGVRIVAEEEATAEEPITGIFGCIFSNGFCPYQ